MVFALLYPSELFRHVDPLREKIHDAEHRSWHHIHSIPARQAGMPIGSNADRIEDSVDRQASVSLEFPKRPSRYAIHTVVSHPYIFQNYLQKRVNIYITFRLDFTDNSLYELDHGQSKERKETRSGDA